MRPPICAVCDERFGPDSGALLSFKRTAADDDFDARSAQPGFVGHPPRKEWFCAAHKDAARELVHLPLGEALRRLKTP